MKGWKEIPLSDVCTIFDGPHATPKKQSEGIIFLGISSLNYSGRIDPSFFEYVSEDDYKNWTKRVTPQQNDIVFSYETKLGTAGIIPANFKCCLGRRMGLLRPNKKILPRFLLYSYLSPSFQNIIVENTNPGSTVDRIALTELPDFKISVPELTEQQAIVKILQSIDDKIDLLHRQNATLEAMAEALFRQWFVVEAKEEWEAVKIKSLVNIKSGYAFKSSSFISSGFYKLITIKAVQDGFLTLNGADSIDDLPYNMPEYCKLAVGDILLSLTGNVGRCCFVDQENTLLNQRVALLVPNNPRDWAFTYILFRQQQMKASLEDLAKGSAQANLSPIETGDMEFMAPSASIFQHFQTTTPLLGKVIKNKLQIYTLEKLRDTLLPKLMSGEVRVKC